LDRSVLGGEALRDAFEFSFSLHINLCGAHDHDLTHCRIEEGARNGAVDLEDPKKFTQELVFSSEFDFPFTQDTGQGFSDVVFPFIHIVRVRARVEPLRIHHFVELDEKLISKAL